MLQRLLGVSGRILHQLINRMFPKGLPLWGCLDPGRAPFYLETLDIEMNLRGCRGILQDQLKVLQLNTVSPYLLFAERMLWVSLLIVLQRLSGKDRFDLGIRVGYIEFVKVAVFRTLPEEFLVSAAEFKFRKGEVGSHCSPERS